MFNRFQGCCLIQGQIGKLGTEKYSIMFFCFLQDLLPFPRKRNLPAEWLNRLCPLQIPVGEAKTMPKGGVIQFSAMDENLDQKLQTSRQVKYWRYRMMFELAFRRQELNVLNFIWSNIVITLKIFKGNLEAVVNSATLSCHIFWHFFLKHLDSRLHLPSLVVSKRATNSVGKFRDFWWHEWSNS